MSTSEENRENAREQLSQGVMSVGEGTRIFPDVESCIDCGGCVVACKRTWDIPADEQRISVSTFREGQQAAQGLNTDSGEAIQQSKNPGETSVPMQCYHCEEAPCVSVCPVDSLVKKNDGFVEVREDICIGCQYCLSACPFGAPQFPESDGGLAKITGTGGTMDKCTMCEERQEVGKGPACAEECATDAILVGTTDQIADEMEKRGREPFFNDVAMNIIFGEEDSKAFDG